MSRVIYGWRAGSRVNLDAQKAGEAIAGLLKDRNDPLAPETIVEAARDEQSALHEHFTWDDTEAAHKWRCDEARELVRSLTIDVSRSNLEERPVRAFVNVESGSTQGYVSTAVAMSDTELRRQVLARAFAELEAWRRRHAELTELARLFSQIDEARGAIIGP